MIFHDMSQIFNFYLSMKSSHYTQELLVKSYFLHLKDQLKYCGLTSGVPHFDFLNHFCHGVISL